MYLHYTEENEYRRQSSLIYIPNTVRPVQLQDFWKRPKRRNYLDFPVSERLKPLVFVDGRSEGGAMYVRELCTRVTCDFVAKRRGESPVSYSILPSP